MTEHNLIEFEDRVERGHIQFRCKCLHCGLHFIIYSWYKDWNNKVGTPICPECGLRKSFVLATIESEHHIFEKVPGKLSGEDIKT